VIYEIIDHPEIKPQFDIVEQLARIDLTKDVVICFNPLHGTGDVKRVVSYDVDQFAIKTHEALRSKAAHTILTYKFYPRIKLSLPSGLYPNFSSAVNGLQINHQTYKKMQGIELEETLKLDTINIDFAAETGRYAFYEKFEFSYGVFDPPLFGANQFKGNHIPLNTNMCYLRLIPHFIGTHFSDMKLNNIYIICSKYIHTRLPDF